MHENTLILYGNLMKYLDLNIRWMWETNYGILSRRQWKSQFERNCSISRQNGARSYVLLDFSRSQMDIEQEVWSGDCHLYRKAKQLRPHFGWGTRSCWWKWRNVENCGMWKSLLARMDNILTTSLGAWLGAAYGSFKSPKAVHSG